MVSLSRVSTDGAVVAPRDATVASAWRDLNRFAIRVGAVAGFFAALGYLALATASGDSSFLVSAVLGVVVGIVGLIGMVRRTDDGEAIVTAAAFAVVTASTYTSPLVRGGMWAAIAVLTMIGALLLPRRKQMRFISMMGAILLAQLAWPLFDQATLVDTLANVLISTTCAAAGIVIIVITRNTLEQTERSRIEIFRSVPVGLFRTDPDGLLIDANPAMSEMLQCTSPSDLIGRAITDLYEDEDAWLHLVRALDATERPQRFANKMIRRDGTVIWIRGHAQAIRSESGAVRHYEGAIENITQRREIEESARKNAERFKNVFERAPIGIWEEDFSAVGRRLDQLRDQGVSDLRSYLADHPDEVRRLVDLIEFSDVNPAGIALIGASSKEQALRAVVPESAPAAVMEGFVDEFLAIWEDREAVTIEIQGATATGTTTDLALSWAVGRDHDGSLDLAHCVVAIQDIKIVKEAERELAALVESKDELIAAVSHELRTPMTTILGMSFELRDHGEQFSRPEVGDMVAMIADQSRELANIVEDLLVAARTEAGTLSIRPESVDIADEFRRIMSMDPGGPVVDMPRPVIAWADPLRVRQILRNLVTNADRYGGDEVRVEAKTLGPVAVIRVRDTGAGVPWQDRESIFEPYVRSGGDAALPGSLGLGLPVSRRLARLMGGDLTYRYDGESIFELRLPADTSVAAA